MAPLRRGPLFLERQVYRRRRLMDAARILPVLGFVALLLPPLWSADGETGTAAEAVYLFGLWALLIGIAALLSRPLREALERDRPAAATPGQAPAPARSPARAGAGPPPTTVAPPQPETGDA